MLLPDLLAEPDEQFAWVCAPFLARQCITLVHGKKSIGKTPLSWELSGSVATGGDFLGTYPAREGRVLYLEKDTPKIVLKERLRKIPAPHGHWDMEFILDMSVDLANPRHPCHAQLHDIEIKRGPFDLVCWNPLSKLYIGSEGDVIARVYDAMQRLFPRAAHYISSHDRKEDRGKDARTIDTEEHSGRQEWVNLAANVFRLKDNGHHLTLVHTGCQIAQLLPPIELELYRGNSGVRLYERIADVEAQVASAPGRTKGERIEHVARQLGRTPRTIQRALADAPISKLVEQL